MQMITNGSKNYGAMLKTTSAGEFEVIFLYNMQNSVHMGGDVDVIKRYKTEKIAITKINKWITAQV